MPDGLQTEFEQLLQELTTKICRELLTEDLEKFRTDLSKLAASQTKVTSNLNSSAQKFQSMSERADYGLRTIEENNKNTKDALDYVLRQNQDFVNRVEAHYESLFAEYEDKITSLKNSEQRGLIAAFEQQVAISGNRLAKELQETLIKDNFLNLEKSMDSASRSIGDLLASRDALFTEIFHLVQKISKQFLEPPGAKLEEASKRIVEQTIKLLQSISLLNSIVKEMQTSTELISVLGKNLQDTQNRLDDLKNIIDKQQDLIISTHHRTEEMLSQMRNTIILKIKQHMEAETEKSSEKILAIQQQLINMRSIVNATNNIVSESILEKLLTEKWVKIGLGVLYGLLFLIFLKGCAY